MSMRHTISHFRLVTSPGSSRKRLIGSGVFGAAASEVRTQYLVTDRPTSNALTILGLQGSDNFPIGVIYGSRRIKEDGHQECADSLLQ